MGGEREGLPDLYFYKHQRHKGDDNSSQIYLPAMLLVFPRSTVKESLLSNYTNREIYEVNLVFS